MFYNIYKSIKDAVKIVEFLTFKIFPLPFISFSFSGSTKNEARDKACDEALDILSKKCYTILVKNRYLSAQGETIDANDVTDANPNNDSTGYATQ